MHFVSEAFDGFEAPPCEANPAGYVCVCKGYKTNGYCSAILAINNILKKYDLKRAVALIAGAAGKGKSGGNRKSLPKALECLQCVAPDADSDSSDEEDVPLSQRLLTGKGKVAGKGKGKAAKKAKKAESSSDEEDWEEVVAW